MKLCIVNGGQTAAHGGMVTIDSLYEVTIALFNCTVVDFVRLTV